VPERAQGDERIAAAVGDRQTHKNPRSKEVHLSIVDLWAPRFVRVRAASGAPTEDPLQLVRWIFLVFSLLSAALFALLLAWGAMAGRQSAALAGCLLPLLAAKWMVEYRGGVNSVALDLMESAALFAVAVASQNPVTILLLLLA
jgi:hypothetical protein